MAANISWSWKECGSLIKRPFRILAAETAQRQRLSCGSVSSSANVGKGQSPEREEFPHSFCHRDSYESQSLSSHVFWSVCFSPLFYSRAGRKFHQTSNAAPVSALATHSCACPAEITHPHSREQHAQTSCRNYKIIWRRLDCPHLPLEKFSYQFQWWAVSPDKH